LLIYLNHLINQQIIQLVFMFEVIVFHTILFIAYIAKAIAHF